MEKLFEQISKTTDRELPTDLRLKIKRQLLVLKFRPYLLMFFALVIANLLFLSLHVHGQIIESEALSVLMVFVRDFEFSFDYLTNFFAGANEVLPMMEILLWAVNFSLVFYLVKVGHRYRRQLFNIY